MKNGGRRPPGRRGGEAPPRRRGGPARGDRSGRGSPLARVYLLAARLAKGDAGFRDKANRVARDFVYNRRELGKALDPVIPHKGGRPTENTITVIEFGIDQNVSTRAQLLARIPENELEAELGRMAEADVIQMAPLYRMVRWS